jgi:hypothetical protein
LPRGGLCLMWRRRGSESQPRAAHGFRRAFLYRHRRRGPRQLFVIWLAHASRYRWPKAIGRAGRSGWRWGWPVPPVATLAWARGNGSPASAIKRVLPAKFVIRAQAGVHHLTDWKPVIRF